MSSRGRLWIVAESGRVRGRPARTSSPSGRDRLLRAARTEFARNGLAGTSVENLTRVAGVSAPTLYHHFDNKAGLFIAAAADVYDTVVTSFRSAVNDDQSFAEAFVAVLESSVPIMRADPSLSAMIAVVQTELKRDVSLSAALRPPVRSFRSFFDDIASRAPMSMCPDAASRRHLALALITIVTGLNAQAPLLHGLDDYIGTVHALQQLLSQPAHREHP